VRCCIGRQARPGGETREGGGAELWARRDAGLSCAAVLYREAGETRGRWRARCTNHSRGFTASSLANRQRRVCRLPDSPTDSFCTYVHTHTHTHTHTHAHTRLAVKTASEMTYIVSSGALNSTPTNQPTNRGRRFCDVT